MTWNRQYPFHWQQISNGWRASTFSYNLGSERHFIPLITVEKSQLILAQNCQKEPLERHLASILGKTTYACLSPPGEEGPVFILNSRSPSSPASILELRPQQSWPNDSPNAEGEKTVYTFNETLGNHLRRCSRELRLQFDMRSRMLSRSTTLFRNLSTWATPRYEIERPVLDWGVNLWWF
jgi:hypothetical protein